MEAFFNEYYYPGFAGGPSGGKDPHPTEAIATKDRRQPSVLISYDGDAHTKISSRTINLHLDIVAVPPDKDHSSGSGATDLRLFRNGLLIRKWTGDVLDGEKKKTIDTPVTLVAGENRFKAYAFNSSGVKSADASISLRGSDALKRTGTAYVLSIGIGRYANPQYNLNYPVADAGIRTNQGPAGSVVAIQAGGDDRAGEMRKRRRQIFARTRRLS